MKKYIRPEAEYIEFYSEETITGEFNGSNIGDVEAVDGWTQGE